MKDVWKHIISWGKVIAVLAMVVKGALWLDDRLDASGEKLDEIQQNVEHINVEQQFMAEDILAIKDTLEDFEAEHKKQGAQIKSIVWGINHMDQFSPEDFEEIMDEMLKKKRLGEDIPGVAKGVDDIPKYKPYRGEVVFIPLDTIQ